jgi:hypothetical protein
VNSSDGKTAERVMALTQAAGVDVAIERLSASNITLTTRLVDAGTTPMLLRMVHSGRLDAKNSLATGSSYRKS